MTFCRGILFHPIYVVRAGARLPDSLAQSSRKNRVTACFRQTKAMQRAIVSCDALLVPPRRARAPQAVQFNELLGIISA